MVSLKCVRTKEVSGRYCAAYVTRIRVKTGGRSFVAREGNGAGASNASLPRRAHEFAARSSVDVGLPT